MKFWLYSFAVAVCCICIPVLLFNMNAMNKLKCIFTHLKYFESDRPSDFGLASSVWCVYRLDGSNLCSFKNLYHLPQYKQYFFFLLNEYSVISGVKTIEMLKQFELSTVRNHSTFHLKLVIIDSSEYLLKQHLVHVNDDIFLMKRFKPDNIMHIIHDDLLPLFFTFNELCKGDIYICLSMYKLLFIDDYGKGPYHEWYEMFSYHKSIFLDTYKEAICFRKIVLGLNRKSIWFQYGFKNVQGPLLKSDLNAIELKQFTDFIKYQLGIVKGNISSDPQNEKQLIFLSRKINRRILGETEVAEHIKEMSNRSLKILTMDLSVNSSKELISSLQITNNLIGMHGSAIILSIFLPQGSNIIELFPFGIQPKFVSPLKALCSLPNMFYNYHSWVNENESNTITHPEYPTLLGGLYHLSTTEQENIMNIKLVPAVECCHNPVYLFRMFQDTIVDESFYKLAFSVLNNVTEVSLTEKEVHKITRKNIINSWYHPPPVFNLTCECNDGKFVVRWNYFKISNTRVTFSVATSTGITANSKNTYFNIENEKCSSSTSQTSFVKPPISVWVKAVEDYQESVDSYTKCT
ncbi:protein O-linked-mannose beta-1,4-N-acetylglucosaminyltransferase 2-like [Homalodisca vitripennis]|uniref:protein O-linked-mannose beta-1,4-N-acetylglucosaminyltransferase 2-like n=1 Tax=Homalodisca vitripennis TaxID=197043 RepID=UPI001EEC106E|nr:protein O-linked-mannose beta-1,4-N-acetylglucosaminyltransferase 2-like [Homalodisca vitripennis]